MDDTRRASVPAGVVAALPAFAFVCDLTAEWARDTRSVLLETVTGERVVAQWGRDRRAIARRLRVGRWLATTAPDIPIAPIVAGDAGAPVPYAITRFIAGVSGRRLLASAEGAAELGRAVGAIAASFARVGLAGIGLTRRWTDPAALRAGAERWLDAGAGDLGARQARQMANLLRAPLLEPRDEPRFAHGDLAPVNVIVQDDGRAVLLDFEAARIASPLFDAASWSWVLGYHHPDRAGGVAAFNSAAGIAPDGRTQAAVHRLAALQCLERLAQTPRRDTHARHEWASKIAFCVERV